jgi:hypothetical protein
MQSMLTSSTVGKSIDFCCFERLIFFPFSSVYGSWLYNSCGIFYSTIPDTADQASYQPFKGMKNSFASKNLYNAALYEIRQAFIFTGIYLNYNEMDKRMQSHEAYKALSAKVSQQVLRGLDTNWKSFFATTKKPPTFCSFGLTPPSSIILCLIMRG